MTLARLHRAAGLLTLAAFLLTGAAMKLVYHPSRLPDREHLLFVSRHIYILGNAVAHLALAAYVAPRPTRGARAVQRTGSGLLAASSLLLIAAFAAEPVAGRDRTLVSSLGLYSLLAGALLHSGAAGVRARRHPRAPVPRSSSSGATRDSVRAPGAGAAGRGHCASGDGG